MENESLFGTIALVLVALLGSSMGIYARELATDLNVFEQVALRSAIGAALLLALMRQHIRFRKLGSAPRKDVFLLSFRALAIYCFAICLGTLAFVHGKYTSIAIVMALPIPAIMGVTLFNDSLTARNSALAITAFLGAVLTIWAGSREAADIDWPLILALASAVFMSFGILAQRWQSDHFNLAETTFFMLAFATFVLAGLTVAVWVATHELPQPSLWLFGVATVAGATSVAFMLLSNYGVPRVSGIVVNNSLALQPVFAAGIGALVYSDKLGVLEAIGATMILASIVFLKR